MGLFNKYFEEVKKIKRFSAFISWRMNTFRPDLGAGFGEAALKQLTDLAGRLGGDCYLSDGMFVWGRVLGWIRDEKFQDACSKSKPSLNDSVDSSIYWRTHIACWASSIACKTSGDFFEFGCHMGYTACAVRSFVDDKFKEQNGRRKYFWFDMFSEGEGGSDKCAMIDQSQSEQSARERSKLFDDVFLVKGDIQETYVKNEVFSGRKIAFAHFDLNDHLVEMSVIEKAARNVEKGTVFLFDDFAMCPFENQNKIYRKFFRGMDLEILELPTGQGIVIF